MKIAVIDDAFSSRKIIKDALKEVVSSNYEILEAKDGNEGIDLILQHKNDLKMIITDINMPNKNGIEMLEQLKRENAQISIPIIIISTEFSPELKDKTKSLGALAWLLKPTTRNAISVLVKNFLNE